MDSKDVRGNIYGLGFCLSKFGLLGLMVAVDAPAIFVGGLLTWSILTGWAMLRQFAVLDSHAPVTEALGTIAQDYRDALPLATVPEKQANAIALKVAQITSIPFDLNTESKWWITPEMVLDTSWLVVGSRGSGKSLTMRWMARQALAGGADVYWFDWHHNPQGKEHIDVLPGVPHEDYVMGTKQRQMATLKYIIQLGQDRLQGHHGTDYKPVVIFWDEFQDLTSSALSDPFSLTEQDWVQDAVRIIQDGFRKALIQIVCSTKSIKKGQSGFDMSVLLQMNWIFTGKDGKNFSAIEDKNAIFPDEISENRLALVSDAKGKRNPKDGMQGAICLIDGESGVKLHPDNRSLVEMLKSQEPFEVESPTENLTPEQKAVEFFSPHMTVIESQIAHGMAKSTIFDGIPSSGKRATSNPKWVWFVEMYESLKSQLVEVA